MSGDFLNQRGLYKETPMSEDVTQHLTCRCGDRIDEVRDIGPIRWFHCDECGEWSATLLRGSSLAMADLTPWIRSTP